MGGVAAIFRWARFIGLAAFAAFAVSITLADASAQEMTFKLGERIPAEYPGKIVSILPKTVKAGQLVTIEIDGVPSYPYKEAVSVLFDAHAVFPETSSSPGLIIARVPTELTETNRSPTVYVRFKGFLPLKFEGIFSVIPKSDPTEGILEILRWAGENVPLAIFYTVMIFMTIAGIPGMVVFLRLRHRVSFADPSGYRGVVRHKSISDNLSESLIKPPIDLPLPEVPDALAMAVAKDECVVYAGAGLSAQSGLPVWNKMLREVVDRSTAAGLISSTAASSLNRLLRRGENEDAADGLVSVLGTGMKTALSYMEDILHSSNAKPSDAHKQLARLPLSGLVTTNFDDLLERAFKDRHPPVFTPRQAEDCLDALIQKRFFLLKLSGALDDPHNAILAPKQHADMVRESQVFDGLLDRLFLTRTMFFVGVSFDGIEDFFRGTSSSSLAARHFALVAAEDDSWEIKAATLLNRHGVQVLPFSLADRDSVLPEFLKQLSSQTADALMKIDPIDLREGRASLSCLKRVELTNIGPFEKLTLDLNPEWNLLLGDNGVGKSTVLKAIAIGLCGDAAKDWAGRIIKTGENVAEIILHTDMNKIYRTTLSRRSDGRIEIESRPTTPMATEGWLALGFPALRTVSWNRSNMESSLGTGRPVAADLLPIITEGADPRLDGLKQRIVALDHKRKTEAVEGSGERRYDHLMDDLLKLFEEILEGMPIKIKKVDPDSREITVETADGDVPFESLSQGTTSLIGWAGVLLQRLHETAPKDKQNPRDRFAVVLIDELDAHMHPSWQQGIVNRLSKIFPNVQFIAATHSPLVVQGIDVKCVTRFKRNEDGVVEKVNVAEDMTMGRADQVLAGSLFDTGGLDDLTEEIIEEYQDLLTEEERNPEQQERYQKLQKELEFRIPVPDTTPRDRRAREVFTELLEVQMHELSSQQSGNEEAAKALEEAEKHLMKRAGELFDELERNRGVKK